MRLKLLLLFAACGLVACDVPLDMQRDSGTAGNDGGPDAGEVSDSGELDAGPGGPDASVDAGEPDGGPDAGPDAGVDSGVVDAGPPSISISDSTAIEGDTNSASMVFAVKLSVAQSTPVTVSYTTADGTATEDDYTPMGGVVTFAPGTTSQTISVPLLGDVVDENDETFTVTISNGSGSIPITRATATGVIVDDDASPTLSIVGLTLDEGAGKFSFVATLSAASGRPVTFDFATANQTATAGADYTAAIGSSTIVPGETIATIDVPILPDALNEADETFTLNLSKVTNANATTLSVVGKIVDDDPAPTLTVDDLTETEGNSGTHNAVFTFTLSSASGRTITVNYATMPGTATSPADFTATSGTLTFMPGDTQRTVGVPIVGDLSNEPIETFTLVLSNAVGTSFAPYPATCTITNDDGPPTLNAFALSAPEGNDGGTKVFPVSVTLAPASGVAVTVSYATSDATAVQPADYTSTSGSLTFAPGETVKYINVPVKQDLAYENDETFVVTLSNTTAVLGQPTAVVTIQNDDTLPTVSVSPVSIVEGTGAVGVTTPVVFNVQLSAASSLPATVTWGAVGNNAIAGYDFAFPDAGTTINFAPGETQKSGTVYVVPDALWEATETFAVTLQTASGATILPASASATISILDDDPAPSFSIPDNTKPERNPGQSAGISFLISLSARCGQDVQVSYATKDGTALAVTDYVAKSAIAKFPVDPLTGITKDTNLGLTVTIQLVNDLVHEPTETFTVELSAQTPGVLLVKPTGVGTITDDDP